MPSLAESRREVRDRLDKEVDHDALLASLQDEIDRHNAVRDDLRDSIRESRRSDSRSSVDPPLRFRFKAGTEDPRERRKHRRRTRRDEEGEQERRRKRRKGNYPTPPHDGDQDEGETSHPFPREPADPAESQSDAFRASLFDALADDEGAAAYWENVYNEPIHVYPRPAVPNIATGELEEMNDEEYVEYVKRQMWERKHPEVVYERKRRERERKAEEEERTRRREEFVRRQEQAAWERSQRRRFRADSDGERKERYEYEFADEKEWNSNDAPRNLSSRREYLSTWSAYLTAWDQLKLELLEQRENKDDGDAVKASKRIPWPVLKSQAPTKPNIVTFMQHAPADERKERLRMLKAERVRWHPDKVQQRFGGAVDEGTMKLVTGVFQVVDGMVEEERKRMGSS